MWQYKLSGLDARMRLGFIVISGRVLGTFENWPNSKLDLFPVVFLGSG